MTIKVRPRELDELQEQVAAFSARRSEREARSADLLRAGASPEQDPEVLRRALEELRVHNQELAVAEEELSVQLDALVQAGLRAEAERERYVDLFEQSPDAYVVTDMAGVIRDANAAAVNLFDVDLRYLRGKPVAGLLVAGAETGPHAAIAGLVRGGETATMLTCSVRPRGRHAVPCVARLAMASRRTRVFWTFRRALAPAEEQARELERSLRDKEDLLERERRRSAELERANEAKDRFIAVLSHDLRSPLNAIVGWVQLLRRETLDTPSRARALETIERNAQAQAALIDELLDISRMAADHFHLELELVDLGALVASSVEGALPKALELGISLRFVPPPATAMVMGDPRRLAQIVGNLLANALKFTRPGGNVEAAIHEQDDTVELFVRDDGRGVRPAMLPRLFDLYAQDREYAGSRQGLGLGLYIVRRLVELQFGTVRAESEGEGKGATFVVALPRHAERPSATSVPPPVSMTRLRGLRILVVDDEDDSRELMATILRRAEADVRAVESATAAIALHREGTFDVVVSDLEMPGIDGCALVRELRVDDAELAALAVSGYAAESDAARALAAGFDVHLAKPCGADELIDAVQRAAGRRRQVGG